MGTISRVWIGQTLGVQNRSSAIVFLLFGSSALVWYVMCLDFLNGALWVRFHGWYLYKSFIDGSNIGGVYRTPLVSRNGPPTIGQELFGIRAIVLCVRCLVSLNCALWVRIHGWYWYQSFIDVSNIWGVNRTIHWGPEMDHPPLGLSYLVVVSSYHLSCALILVTGLYGWDYMFDIDINPASIGPILVLWIGQTLGSRNGPYATAPKVFGSSAIVWYVMWLDSLN